MASITIWHDNGTADTVDPSRFDMRAGLQCDHIDGGIIPPAGDAPSVTPGNLPILGGVYTPDGQQVPRSVVHKARAFTVTLPYAPETVCGAKTVAIDREAVYCGYLQPHFGHFLIESTARLWWGLREGFDGVFVYQSPHTNPLQLSYVRDFLALVGLSDRVLIAEDWLRFPVVHMPEAAHRFNAHIAPEFQVPFQRAADAARAKAGPDLPAKLYVSRSKLDSARIIGEEIVEEMFAAEGYRVIHPQTLPLAEQAALFNAATSVAGFIGSAMHNIVFSRGGIEVTCIARDAKIGESYLLIDQLLGNDGTYLVAKSADRTGLIGRHEPFLLDIDALAATLRAAGRIGPDNRPSYSKRRLKRDFEAERNYQLASNRRSPHPPLRRLGLTLKAIALRPFWAPPWKILPQRLYRALTSARR